jgi:hypothetical protein
MNADFGLAHLRDALDTLQRLRGGWRPDECLLADARYAQRWAVTRHDDGAAYQFVGFTSQLPVWTFTVIATVLAIDPSARWALLFGGGWIVIGDPLPTLSPFDPADVAKRGETWLLSQMQ